MSARGQLASELQGRLSPLIALLGDDLSDAVSMRVQRAADVLVESLCSSESGRAEDAAARIVEALQPELSWWRSELGLLVARVGEFPWVSLTQREAAEVLGVSRGTVAVLVHRGSLAVGGDGRLSLGVVLERLVHLNTELP